MTHEPQTTSLFRIHSRYLRSANLVRDWNDPNALENYVYTNRANQSLSKFALGLRPFSSLRAWRITGDYGSGKSSFALLLANVMNCRLEALPSTLQATITEHNDFFLTESQPKLLPVLITGSRAHLGRTILESIITTLTDLSLGSKIIELDEILNGKNDIEDQEVLLWIKKAQKIVISNTDYAGLALIIDEAGKFLEFSAINPHRQDIYLLQSLAEFASRSGKNPFIVITILHQGISSYADLLSKAQQREWEKVAGRFEEIAWHFSIDQTVSLIASSLNTDTALLKAAEIEGAQTRMRQAVDLGWYGISVDRNELLRLSTQIYPLDPAVIPVLVRFFSNFGQNERSLYSFLLGIDDFGLQDFVLKTGGTKMFKLHDLYDYARATFGPKLAGLSYYWKAIDEVVSTYSPDDVEGLELLKTMGIINLINTDSLVASKEIILLSTSLDHSVALQKLLDRNIIHYRGHAGGFCVWPHSSVNLQDAYEQAVNALGPPVKEVKTIILELLTTRPIVARRHYIETGNLRFFNLRYVEVEQMNSQSLLSFNSDGLIVVPLCETPGDVEKAKELALNFITGEEVGLLFAVPEPLQNLAAYLEEVRRWQWVEKNVVELRQDRFARDEVSKQLYTANAELQRHIHSAIGLTTISRENKLSWFHNGQKVRGINSNKNLMSLLANICDTKFRLTPRIHNELINRRELSSAAASARMRLCERLFEFSTQPFLGMDPASHPPEMSMYLSVLREAGLHQKVNGNWVLQVPNAEQDEQLCNVAPTMERISELLSSRVDERVPATLIFEELTKAPYGVRAGVIPLLFAVFAVINEHSIAFYEDGSFIPRITGSNYLRLIKAPETFEIQFYPISTVRTSLFQRLVQALNIQPIGRDRIDLLDVVKPLVVFMGTLPDYVSNTNSLTPQVQKVRSLLRTTKNPVALIFKDLPEACGMSAFSEEVDLNLQDVDEFINKLKSAVDELRSCYPQLLDKLRGELVKELKLTGSFEENRKAIATRAKSLAGFVTEIRLKSFCLRLADTNLSIDLWTESLATLICSMPSTKWRDKDLHTFEQEIHKLTQQFLRVEATVFNKIKHSSDAVSVRVALTKADGTERDRVIHLTENDSKKVKKLEDELAALVEKYGDIGMAAASNVLWKMMTRNIEDTTN